MAKRHSVKFNSVKKAIRTKYPDMSEKAVNIRAIYACRTKKKDVPVMLGA